MLIESSDSPQATTLGHNQANQLPALKFSNSGNPKLRHFAAFVMAARCETFVQASRELCISQPSLSRNIHELEQALGKALFLRSDNRMELSSAGRLLLPHAIELLSAHLLAMEQIARSRTRRAKVFRAIASPWMAPLMTAPLVKLLHAEFDFATVTVQCASCADVELRVVSGDIPLGVSAGIAVQPDLWCTAVLEAPLGVLVAMECAMPSRIDTLDALSSIPLVRLDDQASVSLLLQHWGQPFHAYFHASVSLPCVTSGFDLIQQCGMGMITSGIEASHPQAVGLRFVPLPHLLPHVQVRVVSRHRNVIDSTDERMREILCASLCEVDWHPCVARLTTSGRKVPGSSLLI